jgi:lysozyme
VTQSTVCTPQQAEIWFEHDVLAAMAWVDDSLTTNVTQNQFDALVSFTYNVGIGAEGHSALIGYVNQRNFPAGAGQTAARAAGARV